MARDGTEATATASVSAKTPKDTDGTSSPSSPLSPTPANATAAASTLAACRPEHGFHAFDALYCALTPHARPIEPLFSNDK